MEQQTTIFLGPQGSGKGTQVKLLQDFLKREDRRDVQYLEMGAALRALGAEKGFTQEMVGASMARGELQPGFISGYLASKFWIERLHGAEHLIIDGFPRNQDNWLTLNSAMGFYRRPKPALIYLNISDTEAVKRLLARGRSDDTEEGIRHRLAWSHAQVTPIVELFRHSRDFSFFEIDGERSIEEIHQNILDVLGLKAKV